MTDREHDRRRRRWIRALQVTLGVTLGLSLAEGAFWLRDDGAFPHANFYVADPELGVRLEPGATMRFRLGDNPRTTIHVNRQGYRGSDWGPPTDGEILVLGDSQVFGLGVDDDQTFSSELATLVDRPVINAGVPTYGPPEYATIAAELLAAREPTTVVYVLNFLNDPFELGRPNVDRHAVWDGWAVRRETAPSQVRNFPGRRWLMSQSHLIYGLRRWWHQRSDASRARLAAADGGVPSEGDWRDLMVAQREATDTATAAQRTELEAERAALLAKLEADRAHTPRLDVRDDAEIEARLTELTDEIDRLDRRLRNLRYGSRRDRLVLAANPGDIVSDRYSESSRKITVTAEMYAAATVRKQQRDAEAKRLKAERQTHVNRRGHLRTVLAAEQPSEQPEAEPTLTLPELAVAPVATSVFDEHIAAVRDLCEAHGAELLVVALPFDVQVSRAEWAKYGVEDGPDMSETLILLDELTASARRQGIAALDLTGALREAEPGAFLDADIHMTPKGHRAVAEAIATALVGLGDARG